MLEGIVLGAIQGVTEWLPISSEAIIILVKTYFFGGNEGFLELINFALFLHLGTFLAAAWYLRDDVFALVKTALRPHRLVREGLLGQGETERMFRFLALATLMSLAIGYPLLIWVLPFAEQSIVVGTKVITAFVGVLLLGTAFAQWQAKRKKEGGRKQVGDLEYKDGLLLGIIQGFTILPGFSRSGLTISALLLRGYSDTTALRTSFLMSLPAVLGGNVLIFAREGVSLSAPMVVGSLFSFLFGMLTIHVLFRISHKLNFAYFVFFFGILTLSSVFL